MNGEKSDVGIVVNKLAGKAVIASESAQKSRRCKPRLKRRGLDAKPETVEEERLSEAMSQTEAGEP
jgi:hypothetical protein